MDKTTPPPLLDDDATAKILGVATQTLANWRAKRWPDLPFVRVGRTIRYRLSDIERFISKNTVSVHK